MDDSRKKWLIGHDYRENARVYLHMNKYDAKANHTSSKQNRPGTGDDWRIFWRMVT